MDTTLKKLRNIVTDASLNPAQKARYLSLEAENLLAYPQLDAATQQALDDGVICDMCEGHAPFKPRYVLPDYSVVLHNGSDYLELPAPKTLAEAINTLMIAYHHVPSVTGMPVYIGLLDQLLLPFCDGVSDDDLYQQIRLFWRYLDRTLPDAFMHANIGPTDNRVARTILRVDAESQQTAPNLTLFYDPEVSSEQLLAIAASNIIECCKPHIANHQIHSATFDELGYGIVSCYNALPLAGGSSTLTRVSLKAVAERSSGEADFFERALPYYLDLQFRLMQTRINFLYEESNFFESFLVSEGWIKQDRFTAMYGIYAMAEAVNALQDLAGRDGRYGFDETANALGHKISAVLADTVAHRQIDNCWRGRAMLHSQAGLSTDQDETPGVRIPYGTEPDPVSHILALAPHHQHYESGISEILTLDETIRNNPEAIAQLCKGAFENGFREFSANVSSNDLVRVTGYMIRRSDVDKYKQGLGSRTNTTALGSEAVDNNAILERKPRVVSHEFSPSYD